MSIAKICKEKQSGQDFCTVLHVSLIFIIQFFHLKPIGLIQVFGKMTMLSGDSLVESLVLHSTLPQVLTGFWRWCKVGQDDFLILSERKRKQIKT